MATAALSNK